MPRYTAFIQPETSPPTVLSQSAIAALMARPYGPNGPTPTTPITVEQPFGAAGLTAFRYDRDTTASPFASLAELEQLAPARWNRGGVALVTGGLRYVNSHNFWRPEAASAETVSA